MLRVVRPLAAFIAFACCTLVAPSSHAAPPAQPAAPKPPPALQYQGVIVKQAGDSPEACLQFSDKLNPKAEAQYGDYVSVEPAAKPAIRADGKQLCLGGLSYGTDYKVTLHAGMPALSAARIAADMTVDVGIADRAPLIAIAGDGWILPKATANGLTIQTVNVPKLRIYVLRMSERLLTNRLRGDSSISLTQEQIEGYALRSLVSQDATVIWKGTMDVAPDRNRTVQTAFPLAKVIQPNQPGAYLVLAENPARPIPPKLLAPTDKDEDYSPEYDRNFPAHWVIVSDIGLTTMRGQDGLHVFVRSLGSAAPLSGVKLQLLSTGQDVLGEASTDASGQAAFPAGLLRGHAAASPATVVAHAAGGGFALLDLTRAAFDLSDRGVSGRPAAGPVDAYLYTDRGIYRPGETVNLMALLRTQAGAALDNAPVTLVLRRPDGVEARRVTMQAAPDAGFYQAFALSKTAAHGMWSVEALADPAGPAAGRVQFDVQDFVPQQLKVTLTAAAQVLRAGSPIDATLDGRFLYGAPAAGLSGEANLRLVRDPTPVADAPGYQFGLVDEKIPEKEQKLDVPEADDAGRAHIDAPFEAPQGVVSPLKAVLTAGLFEPSGRIVQDSVELKLRTTPVLIGIHPRQSGSDWNGVPASFDLRVFDADGRPVARTGLSWTLVREDRHYDWYETDGAWRFHYHVVDVPLDSGTIDVPADRPAQFSHQADWGDYRLVVTDPQTQAATSVRFTSGWETTGESPDTPDKVDLTADATTLPAGGTAHLHIKGPFAGKALITIANEGVIETRSIDVPAAGTTFEVKASPAWGTGAYVLVSMYRALQTPAARPHDPVRAIGVAWLATDPAPRTLGVTIGAPQKVTPRQTVQIPVHVTGLHAGQTAYVTLAAVDEGILQLTRFKSPDPNSWLLGKRRLGIEMRDDYGRLLDGSAPAGAIREGGDEGVGGPALPVTSAHIVSLFHAPVTVDASGNASVPVDIPDFAGELRLMAVAYDHDAVGHADAALTVRDPVVADIALPRFLAPGDSAQLAVQLHDLDAPGGDYHLALTTDGPISLDAGHKLDYHLAQGERHGDSVTLSGLDQGVGTLNAELTGPDGLDIKRTWQIAVRAPHYPITLAQTEMQAPGETYKLDPALLAQFVPGSVTVSLGYSAYAGIDVPGLLQSLYRYPYGCTEQLASSAFPLVYFNDPALLGRVPRDAGVQQRVQQAIETILDRQDLSGRFGLWRVGDGEASAWLNVYALDFLLHAKEAGFAVPDRAIRAAQRWLQPVARGDTTQAWSGAYAEEASVTQAYAEYVLARSSWVDLGALRRMHDALAWNAGDNGVTPASVRWKEGEQLATPLALGQLAGALSLMGDTGRALDTFNLAIANIGIRPAARWWFDRFYYTPERDLAGLIAIAAETGNDALANRLVERLRAMHLPIDRLNTQDKAWLLAAAHALNRNAASQTFVVNDAAPQPMTLPATFAPDVAAVRAGYAVKSEAEKPLWRTLTVHGAPVEALPALEHGYTLQREYLDLNGKPIDPSHLRQNDRFIVSLSGASRDRATHRTVLVDMLPAGWEIEAPIANADTYDFLAPLSQTRLKEARDDRFVAAFDLGKELSKWFDEQDDSKPHLEDNEFHVAYLVRVVTPGHFALPESEVEDMYRPDLMARTAAGETDAAAR